MIEKWLVKFGYRYDPVSQCYRKGASVIKIADVEKFY